MEPNMKNTTVNISDFNHKNHQNADFLLAMESVRAVLDGLGKIGKDSSLGGLQKDLIELTNESKHRLEDLHKRCEQLTTEGAKNAVLLELKQQLQHNELLTAPEIATITGASTIAKIIDTCQEHVKNHANTVSDKDAELRAGEVIEVNEGIPEKVAKSGLLEKLEEQKNVFRVHSKQAKTLSTQIQLLTQQMQDPEHSDKTKVKLQTLTTDNLAAFKQLLHEPLGFMQRSINRIESSIQQATTEKQHNSSLQTTAQEALDLATNDLKKSSAQLGKLFVTMNLLEQKGGPDTTEFKTAKQAYKDQQALRDTHMGALQQAKTRLASATAEVKYKEQLIAWLQPIQSEITSKLSELQTMVQGEPSKDGLEAINKVLYDTHLGILKYEIYDSTIPTLAIDSGKQVANLATLFTVQDPNINESQQAKFAGLLGDGVAIPSGFTEFRHQIVSNTISVYGRAILDQLKDKFQLTDDEKEQDKVTIDAAVKQFKDSAIDAVLEEDRAQHDQLKDAISKFIALAASADDQTKRDGLRAQKKQIEEMIGGIDSQRIGADVITKVFKELAGESDINSAIASLQCNDALNVTNHATCMEKLGDIEAAAEQQLDSALQIAQSVIATIQEANKLTEEATTLETTRQALATLTNDFPHIFTKLAELTTPESQRFFM